MEQATFTDPEDQSAWMYHRWLLSRSLALHAAARGTDSEAEARQVLSAVCYWTVTPAPHVGMPMSCQQVMRWPQGRFSQGVLTSAAAAA